MESHKFLLTIGVWILFVVGVVCIGIGMAMFMLGKPVVDYTAHGFGGGVFVTFSSVVAYLRRKL
ncbi:MAG: hypothetical protein HYX92_19740 [Chloroflexi bacterium]|nr:hypothetical protein [Chloroflexota bacterium]